MIHLRVVCEEKVEIFCLAAVMSKKGAHLYRPIPQVALQFAFLESFLSS